jgi:uncharacterized SAM-binding protein YcdF (DUF218 family)
VHSDPPVHVRWAVLLAGEQKDMERSEAALKLYREGLFDSLILSGPRVFKIHHESEFSREYLVSQGIPADRLFQLPNEALSTSEEAEVVIRQARLLGIDTLLIITVNYHSARAARIYRRLAGGNPVTRVWAGENYFEPGAWWASRGTRKAWLIEWLKTLNTAWELRGQKPLSGGLGPLLLEPPPGASAPVTPPRDSIPAGATGTSGN